MSRARNASKTALPAEDAPSSALAEPSSSGAAVDILRVIDELEEQGARNAQQITVRLSSCPPARLPEAGYSV